MRVAGALLIGSLLGCARDEPMSSLAPEASPEAGTTTEGTDEATGGGSTDSPEEPDVRRCIAPAGVSSAPRSIEDAVDLINALPPPVTVACFVESLERPLRIHATTSTFSAQPSYGAEDPRVFLFFGDLVLSVVTAGEGVKLLEFGQFVDDFQTIKAELELPPEGFVEPGAPFERVRFEDGTGCGLCHRNEHRVSDIPYATAYASLAYQPAWNHDVEDERVLAAYRDCEPETHTERCQILTALFGHGDVEFVEFPDDLPTFGG